MRIKPRVIILTLKRNTGNVRKTSSELGIHRSTVYRWKKRANTGWGLSSSKILPKLPFKPVFLQTDNGLEFQGRFQSLLSDLSSKYHAIHKSTPNENALIERSFRTDEEEFFFRLKRAPVHYDELRIWFAEFLNKYNTWRPHLGINLKTPLKIVQEQLAVANVC